MDKIRGLKSASWRRTSQHQHLPREPSPPGMSLSVTTNNGIIAGLIVESTPYQCSNVDSATGASYFVRFESPDWSRLKHILLSRFQERQISQGSYIYTFSISHVYTCNAAIRPTTVSVGPTLLVYAETRSSNATEAFCAYTVYLVQLCRKTVSFSAFLSFSASAEKEP